MQKIMSIRLVRAFFYSVDGIKSLWQGEQAFRQEIYASVILLPLIFFLTIPSLLKLILILLLLLMLVTEAINSAIETIIDRISTEIHNQSKIAKDMGSAAVCIVILMNVVAWVYVLFWGLKM